MLPIIALTMVMHPKLLAKHPLFSLPGQCLFFLCQASANYDYSVYELNDFIYRHVIV